MVKNRFLIGYYGYWVILTYLNAVAGLAGIYFSLGGNVRYALMCLMAAGLCDGFDGRVASLKKRTDREKSYGIQIDAFADIISFGLLPVFIGYTFVKDNSTPSLLIFYLIISAVFVLTALIRLAYFNVIETEFLLKSEKRIFFTGLPVTSVSMIIPVIYSLYSFLNLSLSAAYLIMLMFISISFIANVRVPKPRGRSLIFLCLAVLPAAIYIIFIGS
ncbi:MAG: phosphatidylserine synthase [Treponema sp.]|nr:phosphatidylserine synthase [Treponema sp.]